VPEVRLLPGREFPMDDDARARFRSRWRELLEGDPTKSRIYKDMGNGVATAGIEYYLPLFFDETATVFDYLGADATVVLHGDLEPAFQRFWQDTKDRYRLVQRRPRAAGLPPEALFLTTEQFYGRANDARAVVAAAGGGRRHRQRRVPEAAARPVAWCAAPRSRWPASSQHVPPRRTACCWWPKAKAGARACSTSCAPARSEPAGFRLAGRVRRPATRRSASPPPRWPRASLGEPGIDLVTETELFATAPTTRRRKKQEQVSDVESLIKDLSELNVGDPVVHTAARHRPLPRA
jgi:transcription-repair coupling factor (superfamily II helicase)